MIENRRLSPSFLWGSCCLFGLGLIAILAASMFIAYLPVMAIDQIWNDGWDRVSVDRTKRIAGRLILALDQYRADNGQYPAVLNDLAPLYLPVIPTPTFEYRIWFYRPQVGGKYYALEFYASASQYPSARFDPVTKTWFEND